MSRSGSGGWFVYTSGTTPPSPESTDPAFPFVVPDPPQGRFAAIADERSPGRFILYRGGWNTESATGLAALSKEINRQAAMIAYTNAFFVYTLISLSAIPLALLVRRVKERD
jgi:hypothetical protein